VFFSGFGGWSVTRNWWAARRFTSGRPVAFDPVGQATCSRPLPIGRAYEGVKGKWGVFGRA